MVRNKRARVANNWQYSSAGRAKVYIRGEHVCRSFVTSSTLVAAAMVFEGVKNAPGIQGSD